MVYCAGPDSDVAVIDCVTNQVAARVRVTHHPMALCYNPQNNKVYCASAPSWMDSGRVAIIDGATNQIVRTVTVGCFPLALCYCSASNRVHCANCADDRLSVIDGASDSVFASAVVDSFVSEMCYSPVEDRLYCARGETLVVVGALLGDVIARLPVQCASVVYDPRSDKVYSADAQDTVTVVSCATSQIVASLRAGGGPLCSNPVDSKVSASARTTESP